MMISKYITLDSYKAEKSYLTCFELAHTIKQYNTTGQYAWVEQLGNRSYDSSTPFPTCFDQIPSSWGHRSI